MSGELNLVGLDAPPILNMLDVFVDAVCAVQPPLWQWANLAASGLGNPVRIPDGSGQAARYWAWNRARLQATDEAFMRRLYAISKYSAGDRDGRASTPQPTDLT